MAVLEAATQWTCAPGFGGRPDKAGAACTTDGGTFTGATFCEGTVCAARLPAPPDLIPVHELGIFPPHFSECGVRYGRGEGG